jgi:predicted nucleic acid-binding protein
MQEHRFPPLPARIGRCRRAPLVLDASVLIQLVLDASVPIQLVLDASVLTQAARGDAGVVTLLQGYGADGQPLIIPVLAVTAASLDTRSEDAEAILHGLERLENAMAAPVRDAEQAVRPATAIARTQLDSYDAHVAAVADAAVCPILTPDPAKWRERVRDLDEPLHFVEIAYPDDA